MKKLTKVLWVLFFLLGSFVAGHSQTIQKKGGIYKTKKSKVVEHHQKMDKKKRNHTKTWNQNSKAKMRTFLKKKSKKQQR